MYTYVSGLKMNLETKEEIIFQTTDKLEADF